MKHYYLFLILFFTIPSFAQQQYSKLKIKLTSEHNISQLAELGVEVDHGFWEKDECFISDFSAMEKQMIVEAGFEIETLVEDVQQYYLNQEGESVESRSDNCQANVDYEYPRPDNFRLGTMIGFYRYAEMLAELDEMHTRFPHLITARQGIEEFRTHQDSSIYWLRISSDLRPLEEKPEVLYTAIHHAREPMSMTQLIYFMWYVLENYEKDEEIKYLLDNTALYFVPCINPDGYLYNELTNPNGAGFWRKNLRDNDGDGVISGSDGVDLNRNYGYKWGAEYVGSSSNFSSQVYRGTSAFSEPETQALAAFCEAHDFKIAMNYHSHGNLLIHPWSYSDQPTEDETIFVSVANAMTRENDYLAGTPTQTVGYRVNGDANDWMYGEETSKGKILTFTPEVGSSFWPPISEIEPNCQANILQNTMTAHLASAYAVFEEESSAYIEAGDNTLIINLKNSGLESGQFKVQAMTSSEDVRAIGAAQTIALEPFETKMISISYEIEETADIVDFLVEIDNLKGFVQQKEVKKRNRNIAFELDDEIKDDSNWIGNWQVTNATFYSESASLTDSPNGNYSPNQYSFTELKNLIDLTKVTEARLQYRAKWRLEPRYDHVQVKVEVETDDGRKLFYPLCGKYSSAAKAGFWRNQPTYNAFQEDWIFEDIDLTPYLEEGAVSLNVRFELRADANNHYDGFYLDDVKIVVDDPVETSTKEVKEGDFKFKIHPNPARQITQLSFDNFQADDELWMHNAVGQLQEKIEVNQKQLEIDLSSWQQGLYLFEWRRKGKILSVEKLVKF
ncbi:MAG: M14 family zinc carboxypeptidase [Bacteroidota bacterium]